MFDAVAYLNEPRWQNVKPGLDRVRELLGAMGNPQNDLRIVHVAGTNGKGSVCACVSKILQEAGYKTGLFISPSINKFEDRISINGDCISDEALQEITFYIKHFADEMPDHPTEYELIFAVAMEYFKRNRCQFVVVEVGLGGRYDATNIITSPDVCVITNIGFDHTDLLGDTLEEIAIEKAGIIKKNSSVVCWPQQTEAQNVINKTCSELKVKLTIPDFSMLNIKPLCFENVSDDCVQSNASSPIANNSIKDDRLVRVFSFGRFESLQTHLIAKYQILNIALGLCVIQELIDRGVHVPDDAIRKGVLQVNWPARFEIVASHPTFIIDGAHNNQGVYALTESLKELFPSRKFVFVVGILADKDYSHMIERVVSLAKHFVVIEPNSSRALSASELKKTILSLVTNIDEDKHCVTCDIAVASDSKGVYADAVQKALIAAGEDGIVCAFGSLYSVSSLKEALVDIVY